MDRDEPLLVVFYQSLSGRDPVREWLKGLSAENRKLIGEDIKTVQYGFPLGMPSSVSSNPNSGKFDRHSPIESPGLCLRSIKTTSFSCTDSLKNPKKHPQKI